MIFPFLKYNKFSTHELCDKKVITMPKKKKRRKNPYWVEEDNMIFGKIKRRKLRKDEYYDLLTGKIKRKKGKSLLDEIF